MGSYTAKQGDIIWLDFGPLSDHEQKGRCPAVVVSNTVANSLLDTRAIVCPISNSNRNIPVQPALDNRTKTQGVVVCDQVRTVDLLARNAVYIEVIPRDLLLEIIDIVYGFIEIF